MNKYRSLYNTTLSLIINLLLVMGCFILCRVIFLIENLKAFSDLTAGRIWRMFEGGFLFDTSAILYTNLLYIFLMLIPLHYKENAVYQKIIKGIFVTTNLIVIIMNLMDTVYFQYTHRRTTASVFSEFKNEGNLGDIIGTELVNHWCLRVCPVQAVSQAEAGKGRPPAALLWRSFAYFGAWSVLVHRRNARWISRYGSSYYNQQRQ